MSKRLRVTSIRLSDGTRSLIASVAAGAGHTIGRRVTSGEIVRAAIKSFVRKPVPEVALLVEHWRKPVNTEGAA